MTRRMSAVFLVSGALAGGSGFVGVSPADAGGVPTVDTSAIAQQAQQHMTELEQSIAAHTAELGEMLNQLEQMKLIYDNAVQQLATLRSHYDAITDIRDLESLIGRSGARASNFRFETWLGLARFAIGEEEDVPPQARVAIERMKLASGMTGLEDLYESDLSRDRRIAEQASVGLAAMATGEGVMAGYDEDAKHLDKLADGVGGQADLKAAIDYNTAVQVEVARLLNRLVLVQAAETQARGSDMALEAAADLGGRRFTDRVEGE